MYRSVPIPDGYDVCRDRQHRRLLTPQPANGPASQRRVTVVEQAWWLVVDDNIRRWVKRYHRSWTQDAIVRHDRELEVLSRARTIASQRAGYDDDEWDAYVAGVRDGRFVTTQYFEEPVEFELPALTDESRPAKVLWAFFAVHVRRFARVRRVVFDWYSRHCGNPVRMDFHAELASATQGLY